MRTDPLKWLFVLVAVLVCTPVARTAAAPPWTNLLTTQRVEADPNKDYTLTTENGPWLIMASTFSGEGAEEQAKELVLELRERYKLPAYVHRVTFDLGDQTTGRGVDRYGQPLRMRYRRGSKFDEIAVLVGNYPTVDDPEAQRTLQKIKYTTPDCLKLSEGRHTTQNLAAWRTLTKYVKPEKRKMGPMEKAFVTTNPLLPKEYFVPKGVDKLVEKMNANVEYSLLDCPGKYTVQVAHFTGSVVIKPEEIRAIEAGAKDLHSDLADAALAANKLTLALRAKGYEAYEFHDRAASIVTIGSFDSVGTPRMDGKIEINPQILRIIETFKGDPTPSANGSVAARTLVKIPFDPQPIPVEVPRRSISADYRHDTASMR